MKKIVCSTWNIKVPPSHSRICVCVCVTLEFIWMCFCRYAYIIWYRPMVSSIVVASSTTCSNSVDMMIWFTIWSYLCVAMRTTCVHNIFIQIPYFRLPPLKCQYRNRRLLKCYWMRINWHPQHIAWKLQVTIKQIIFDALSAAFWTIALAEYVLDVHTHAQSHYAITFLSVYRWVGANFVMGFSSW